MFKIIVIYAALLACSVCSASDYNTIKLQISLSGAVVDSNLVNVIVKACKKHKIPCKEFTAMLAQESMFKVNAVNERSKDYGIGQINQKTIESLKLDKGLLISDTQYSVDAAARVFSYFYKRYSAKESAWYCRYNVGTGDMRRYKLRKACKAYASKIDLYLSKVTVTKD